MRITLSVFIILFIHYAFCQNVQFTLGARQNALGGINTTLVDEWALFNNIGALSGIEGNHVIGTYQNRYGIQAFQVVGAGYVHSFDQLKTGIGFFRSGDDLFSEQRINVGFSHALDRISLGINIDYVQYNVSTVGTRGSVVIEFGGMAEITDQIKFGAHILNVNQAKIGTSEETRIPTIMKAGLAFNPSDKLNIYLETEKDLDFEEVFKFGLEYALIEKVWVRTGLRTAPFNGNFGVGFHPNQFKFDYSYGNDTNLGDVHQVSVSYAISKQ